MTPDSFRHREGLRVRWAEVDAQKIVFNGHYLLYLDTAMAGYWRALAMPYEGTLAQLGGDLFVRRATLDYQAPARFDEWLEIGIRCAAIGRSSMRFEAGVFRRDTRLAGGELLYVYADAAARGSQPVPGPLRDALQAFEAGEPMARVRCGDDASLGDAARALRRQVFVEEQGIAADLEFDPADVQALHAVLENRFGEVLATGRLLDTAAGVGRIGRMATAASMRGTGLGRQVLDALVSAGRSRGLHELLLHAQLPALDFYRRAGWQPQGEVFEEAGIAHQAMRLDLRGSAGRAQPVVSGEGRA